MIKMRSIQTVSYTHLVGNLPFIGDGVDSANGETIYKIEVKNENNKAVVYLDGKKIENGKLEINNLTTAQGFGYVAFNKVGTSATNSQHGPVSYTHLSL